jgi:minor curlin subunit
MKTMNIKLKLAALAAVASLFAAPAFAVTDYDVTGNAVGSDVNTLATTELGGVALSGDGNVAFVNQESSSNIAYVDQTGATNFASVVQGSNDVNIAVVYQIGDANRAAVYQH